MKTEFPEEGKPDRESVTLRMLIMMDGFSSEKIVFMLFTDSVLLIYNDDSFFSLL